MGGFSIFLLDPAFRQHVLFFRLQHRELPDFLQIAVQPLFRAWRGEVCVCCHGVIPVEFAMFRGLTLQIVNVSVQFKGCANTECVTSELNWVNVKTSFVTTISRRRV